MPTIPTPDGFVDLQVYEHTETLATALSEDLTDGYYRLPADLVARFQQAEAAFREVETELSDWIAANPDAQVEADDDPDDDPAEEL